MSLKWIVETEKRDSFARANVFICIGCALIRVQPLRYRDASIEWSKTRGVMEIRRRSTVYSPKFPPNYRGARFKRTLIGLAAVERDEISRGKDAPSFLSLSLLHPFHPDRR